MKKIAFCNPDDIRSAFSGALSQMYRQEVPAYGTLIEIVERVNRDCLERSPALKQSLDEVDGLARLTEERHGAIRLGTADELSMMRRALAVMGMFPVGYYDLTGAGIPVHSTAFRPLTAAALAANPFRVFTSLLRLDLIKDKALRAIAERALAARQIFTPAAIALIEKAEAAGGLAETDANHFVEEVLHTFRWHETATVPLEVYERLLKTHRLIADVVCFKGPHINHLTPRTLDIDLAQLAMPQYGIVAKETIEGPPRRAVPILLRQTSFKALEESVSFKDSNGVWVPGMHTARFGEIEQRGAALTRKGRALYDACLSRAREGDKNAFSEFPDDLHLMHSQGLVYVEYVISARGAKSTELKGRQVQIEALLEKGLVDIHPIVYEDFLPVSAAGIFQSNLGDRKDEVIAASPNRTAFEKALGAAVADEFTLYDAIQKQSVDRVLSAFTAIEVA